MSDINFFGHTTFRNIQRKFGIKIDDRRRHVYLIGKTGMGKSNMMENMAIQDIQEGRGIGYVDPHGDGAERLLDFIPSSRANDVIYFNPADLNFPIAFNVMEKVDIEHRHLVAGGLMGVFKKIWPDVWSARMEYILNNTILALLEYPGATLLAVNRMLSDPEFRKKVVEVLTDPIVKAFWMNEFARYAQNYEVEATAAIQNKIGQFISAPLIRNIIGQVQSAIDMRDVMDNGKILIMNLSKGRIGEDNSMLLGGLLVTKLQLAAMSRVDMPEEKRRDFYLYVDEFQNFATESFANILSEARKYRLALIVGHQYISQMEEEVRDAVFGNVGTLVSFRVGAEDAEFLEKEFAPDFTANDIVNLGKYDIYLKLMIDGLAGRAFSATTLPPFPKPGESYRDKIIKTCRERYATPKEQVEEKIRKWAGFMMESAQRNAPRAQSRLYDAICSVCNNKTKVIFPPDENRPVFCKSCLKKVKQKSLPEEIESVLEEEIKKPAEETILNLDRALNKENVSFGSRTRESRPEERRRERKPVDLDDLKKTLNESLDKYQKESEK